jgi:hypothetical protein
MSQGAGFSIVILLINAYTATATKGCTFKVFKSAEMLTSKLL